MRTGSHMTGQSSSRIGISIGLGLLFIIVLAMVIVPEDVDAQTNPPTGPGDWNIYDVTTISNKRITLQGNLNVYSGGKLTFTNVDLFMAHASLGGKVVRVRNNAQLIYDGGSISHSGATGTYKFIIDSGATVTMDGVDVCMLADHACGYVPLSCERLEALCRRRRRRAHPHRQNLALPGEFPTVVETPDVERLKSTLQAPSAGLQQAVDHGVPA